MRKPHGSPTSLLPSVTSPDFVRSLPRLLPSLQRLCVVPAPAPSQNLATRASRRGLSMPGPPRDARDAPRTGTPHLDRTGGNPRSAAARTGSLAVGEEEDRAPDYEE